jgi:hypothetical protein
MLFSSRLHYPLRPDNKSMRRREALLAIGFGWVWPPNWFHRHVHFAEATFREFRRGEDRRRYLWIHGDERTARHVLREHIRHNDGRAFLIENNVRNVKIDGALLDPNRMFSRIGAGRNLRSQNPSWDRARINAALDRLDRDRRGFLDRILPPQSDGLIVALHNNGPAYSVVDEVAISDATALNDRGHPDEFMLCTMPVDFEKLAKGPYNVLLQHTTPPDDDGSLSRLCASRNIRYVNIEAAQGNRQGQKTMLEYLETHL